MTSHWTSRQTAEWLAGSRSPQLEQHLAECAECRASVRQFEALMGEFRTEVHRRSQCPNFVWTPPVERSRFRDFYPALTAAALLVLLALLILAPARPPAGRPEIARRDSVLLEQVDHELSRSVPEPMEPLMLLVNREAVSRND